MKLLYCTFKDSFIITYKDPLCFVSFSLCSLLFLPLSLSRPLSTSLSFFFLFLLFLLHPLWMRHTEDNVILFGKIPQRFQRGVCGDVTVNADGHVSRGPPLPNALLSQLPHSQYVSHLLTLFFPLTVSDAGTYATSSWAATSKGQVEKSARVTVREFACMCTFDRDPNRLRRN